MIFFTILVMLVVLIISYFLVSSKINHLEKRKVLKGVTEK